MNHLSLLYKPFISIHYFIGNIDWRPLHNGPKWKNQHSPFFYFQIQPSTEMGRTEFLSDHLMICFLNITLHFRFLPDIEAIQFAQEYKFYCRLR